MNPLSLVPPSDVASDVRPRLLRGRNHVSSESGAFPDDLSCSLRLHSLRGRASLSPYPAGYPFLSRIINPDVWDLFARQRSSAVASGSRSRKIRKDPMKQRGIAKSRFPLLASEFRRQLHRMLHRASRLCPLVLAKGGKHSRYAQMSQ
jgi:hypothetical protein